MSESRSTPDRHVVALGGGGLASKEGVQIEDYILGLARRSPPRVCFLPTASGDSAEYVVSFYACFAARRCRPSHLGLFSRTISDLRAHLLAQDVIYVGGGNTANMLAVWRTHGVDSALREAWEAGIVLSGVSAGAICWFDAGVTDSFGPELAPLYDGLALLPGSACPHYDGEPSRRPTYRRLVGEGFPGGLAVEDEVALHFVGTELVEVVSPRPDGRAFRLERSRGDVLETPLPARPLT